MPFLEEQRQNLCYALTVVHDSNVRANQCQTFTCQRAIWADKKDMVRKLWWFTWVNYYHLKQHWEIQVTLKNFQERYFKSSWSKLWSNSARIELRIYICAALVHFSWILWDFFFWKFLNGLLIIIRVNAKIITQLCWLKFGLI